MPTLIDRLSSRLLSTNYAEWHRPRVARRLVVILAPLLVLGGFGIGLVAQHSAMFSTIPPLLFGFIALILGLITLAFFDSIMEEHLKHRHRE
jgi:preprotein translocase subunit SecY